MIKPPHKHLLELTETHPHRTFVRRCFVCLGLTPNDKYKTEPSHTRKPNMSLHSFLSRLCLTHNAIASDVEIVMDNAVPSSAGGAMSQDTIARVENKAVVVVATATATDEDDAPRHQHSDASSSSSSSSSLIMMEYDSQMMMDTTSMAALPGMRQVSSDSSILLLTARKNRISNTVRPNLTRDTQWQASPSSSSTQNATWAEMPTTKKKQQPNHPGTRAMAAGSIGSPPRQPRIVSSRAPLDTPSTRTLKQSSLIMIDTANNPPAIPKQMEEQSGVEKITHEHDRRHDCVPSLTVDETCSVRTTSRYRERNNTAKVVVENSTIVTPTLKTTTNATTSTKFSSSSSSIQGGKIAIGSDRSTTKHLPISLSNLPF
jgi:hypothetical protein